MLRRTFTALAAVGVPARFHQASDILLTYPRFNIASHVSDALPELKEAKIALLSATPNIDSAIPNLQRANEVFSSMPANPMVEKIRRSLTAAKCLALKHNNPSRPLAAVQTTCDTDIVVLKEVSAALATDDWDRSDLEVFDSTCVLLSSYVRSLANLLQAQRVGGNNPDSTKLPSDVMSASVVLKLVAELEASALQFATSDPKMLQTADRLHGLQAVLVMVVEGDLLRSTGMMRDVAVRSGGRMSDNGINPEVGLYHTLHAQMRERLSGFSWGPYGFETETHESIDQAMTNFHTKFIDPTTQLGNGDVAIVMQGEEQFRDCYSVGLLGVAQLYQRTPRADPKEVIFSRYLLSSSLVDILPAGRPGHVFPQHRVSKREMVEQTHRKAPQLYLERALKVNRALYPTDRQNPTAAAILRGLATVYAEMRDYLYASGLFETADDACVANFGPNSYERLELLTLREDFQRRIGSTNEAAVTMQQKQDIRGIISRKTQSL